MRRGKGGLIVKGDGLPGAGLGTSFTLLAEVKNTKCHGLVVCHKIKVGVHLGKPPIREPSPSPAAMAYGTLSPNSFPAGTALYPRDF